MRARVCVCAKDRWRANEKELGQRQRKVREQVNETGGDRDCSTKGRNRGAREDRVSSRQVLTFPQPANRPTHSCTVVISFVYLPPPTTSPNHSPAPLPEATAACPSPVNRSISALKTHAVSSRVQWLFKRRIDQARVACPVHGTAPNPSCQASWDFLGSWAYSQYVCCSRHMGRLPCLPYPSLCSQSARPGERPRCLVLRGLRRQ